MEEDSNTAAADANQTVEANSGAGDLTGTLLSERYLVEECLGEGAMGAVYRAEHTLMKKTVAIKVLRPQVGEREDIIERFRREAQAAAHIDHPNICSASDFGPMEDGALYLVIEYLEGCTLEERLAESERIEPDRALHIAAQICDALGRAHSLDIIHRDLKPENIMLVERDGDADFVKILDFGVAKVRLTDEHEQAQLTQAGTVWGTPAYMSPEQAAGGEIDGRSDLYSLGIILYEMLTGQLPFDDPNPAKVMAKHLTQKPVPPGEVAPDDAFSAHVEALVMQLLEKDPGKRPANAAQLGEQLEAAAHVQEHGPSKGELAKEVADRSVEQARRAAGALRPALQEARGWFARQDTLVQGIAAGAGAALLLLIFVVPVVIAMSSDGPANEVERAAVERDLTQERADFLAEAGLSQVPDHIANNRNTAAQANLKKATKEHPDNPHVAYLRGWVNAERGRWEAAMNHYDKALDEEPLYASDERLLDDVFERFEESADHRAEDAQKLIEAHLDTAFANQKLADTAKFGPNSKVRKRAYTLLERTGRLDDLEDWNRLSVELRHAKGCEPRKELIADIADTDDPRGVKMLEEMANRSKIGCGVLKLQDCIGCIRGDLKEAISELESKE